MRGFRHALGILGNADEPVAIGEPCKDTKRIRVVELRGRSGHTGRVHRMMRRLVTFALFAAACTSSYADDGAEFFEKRIRPIFVEHCYKCHSAEAEKVKGGLLLDSKEGLLKGGDSGPVIIFGKPDESLLIKAVRYDDKDLQMPPAKAGGKLSPDQINDLITWIKMGAPDPRQQGEPKTAKISAPAYDYEAARKLWAFHVAEKPTVPKVKNAKWAKSPIDNFVLAKLEEKGLQPAKPADKRTLIRRATFDLIGLPPTPKEIDDFLADKSPDAFAKVIDRLLASPHYGERWGRHWLDVVRYADSVDSRVTGGAEDFAEAWRYRDWVVNSFNRDLPYDQFVIQQIAGDLLPPPETDGIDTNAVIATGMYAIGNWGNGDADKDKILTDIADDAVDVTGRAFLGLTLACARCHDHKFDPIPTADYYSLAGIFFSSHIIPKLSPKGSGESMLRIPLVSKAEMARRKQREARMGELEKEIERIQDEQISAMAKVELARTAEYLQAVLNKSGSVRSPGTPHLDRLPFGRGEETVADAVTSRSQPETRSSAPDANLLSPARGEDKGEGSALAEHTAIGSSRNLEPSVLKRWIDFLGGQNAGIMSQPVRDLLGNKGLFAWRNAANADTPSVVANSTDVEASFLTIKLPAHRIAIHPSPKNGVAAAWKSPVAGKVQIRGRVVDVDPNCGDGIDWELVRISRGVSESMAKGAIPSGGMEQFIGKAGELSCDVKAGDFLQVIVGPKGGYECDTTMIELEVAETEGQKRVWNLNQDVLADFLASNPHADSFGNADVWYFRDLADSQIDVPAGSGFAKLFELQQGKQINTNELSKVAALIQQELVEGKTKSKGYDSFIAPRGAFWSPLRNDEKLFTSAARDAVAKCKTELAELRSNPPPAVENANGLQEGGVPESPHAGVHDVKIHVRGRYDRLGEVAPRQFPRLLAGDAQAPITEGSGRLQLAKWIGSADNPLTARVMVNRIWQHHFGEGIVRTPNNWGKLGTPPTHPELLDYLAHRCIESGWSIKAMHRALMLSTTYQQSSVPNTATLKADPDNKLFGHMNRTRLEAETLRDSVLAVSGSLDEILGGPSIRDLNNKRRTLYLMTVRSDRSNYRMLFDAADPNAIVEQRIVSTVAPQALFLMNHPFVMAQTKALAERVQKMQLTSDTKKIEWLYTTLYGRAPSSAEIKIGRAALNSNKDQKAALEAFCQVLLCANEFVYVD